MVTVLVSRFFFLSFLNCIVSSSSDHDFTSNVAIWSPLGGGILSGKYNDGVNTITHYFNRLRSVRAVLLTFFNFFFSDSSFLFQIPTDSRFTTNSTVYADTIKGLTSPEGIIKLNKVRKLGELAKTLGCDNAALALAWCAQNPNVSTVLLGASKPEQITQNLKALEVIPKLTKEILAEIDTIMDNKPAQLPTYGR